MSTKNLLLQSATVFLLSGSLAFAQSPGLGNEDDPDLPAPGFVTNADEGVSAEIQAEMLDEDAAATAESDISAQLLEWKLVDYRGATINSDLGEPIGTVEKVTTDATGQNVYLIVTPSSADGTGMRVVPLTSVAYDAQTQGLMAPGGSASVETWTAYDEAMSVDYPEITDEDFDFRDAFNFELEGGADFNTNASE